MSLRSKPIIVYVDELFLEICETPDIERTPTNSSGTTTAKNHSKYGFTDRILDSLSFEINKVYIGFRTLGKMKTQTIGPWTPPVLFMELLDSKYVSTNHVNVEADLDSCFRVRETTRPILFIYKKFYSRKVNVFLVDPESWFLVADELLSDAKSYANKSFAQYIRDLQKNPHYFPRKRGYVMQCLVEKASLEIPVCMQKRMDNSKMLGLELSFIFRELNLCLKQWNFSELLHLIIGIFFSFLRRDAIEEQYGANPHSENLDTRPSTASADKEKKFSDKGSNIDFEALDRDFISGAFVKTGGGNPSYSNPNLKGLKMDEDPPHMRLVLVLQIDALKVQFPLDSLSTDVSSSPANNVERSPALCGVTLTCTGLVYTTIWPAHAKITESSKQISIKYFDVTEYTGMHRNNLLRAKQSLDENGQPLFLNLVPRGVKEFDDFDMELSQGTCIVYKSDYNWPPPPISQGVSVSTEVCISPLAITLNMEIIFRLYTFVMGAWDGRWGSGDWRSVSQYHELKDAHISGTHGAVSQSCVVVLASVDLFLFPNKLLPQKQTTSLPAQYKICFGLTSLVWRHSLDVTLETLIYGRQRTYAEQNDLDFDADFHKEINQNVDLTEQLIDASTNSPRMHITGESSLLSPRFEASVSEIFICVSVNDSFLKEKDDKGKGEANSGRKKRNAKAKSLVEPLWKSLIKVDSFMYFFSIDPHPNSTSYPVDQHHSGPEPINPYNREFYWKEGPNVIRSDLVKVENILTESSLVDLVYVLESTAQMNELVQKWVRRDYGRLSEKETRRRASPEVIHRSERQRMIADLRNRPFRVFSLNLTNIKISLVDSNVNYFDILRSRNFLPTEESSEREAAAPVVGEKRVLTELSISFLYFVWESDCEEENAGGGESIRLKSLLKGGMGEVDVSSSILRGPAEAPTRKVFSLNCPIKTGGDAEYSSRKVNPRNTVGFRWTSSSPAQSVAPSPLSPPHEGDLSTYANITVGVSQETSLAIDLEATQEILKTLLPVGLHAVW